MAIMNDVKNPAQEQVPPKEVKKATEPSVDEALQSLKDSFCTQVDAIKDMIDKLLGISDADDVSVAPVVAAVGDPKAPAPKAPEAPAPKAPEAPAPKAPEAPAPKAPADEEDETKPKTGSPFMKKLKNITAKDSIALRKSISAEFEKLIRASGAHTPEGARLVASLVKFESTGSISDEDARKVFSS